jgi:hypothetical protein
VCSSDLSDQALELRLAAYKKGLASGVEAKANKLKKELEG